MYLFIRRKRALQIRRARGTVGRGGTNIITTTSITIIITSFITIIITIAYYDHYYYDTANDNDNARPERLRIPPL